MMMKPPFYRLISCLGLSAALLASLLFVLSFSKTAAGREELPNLATFTSPLDPVTTTYNLYLPLVSNPYQWHKVGVGLAGVSNYGSGITGTRVFTGFTNYWYHAWGAACADWVDPSDPVNRDIPMVRTHTITSFLSTMQYGPCNDGRPVLVLNEPEGSAQDGLSITQTLYYITSVVNSTWKGPVYVGGIMIQNEDYISNVLTLWATTHNGSRFIPGVAGFHVHPYLNWVPGYSPWLTATQLAPLVDQNVQMIRDFVAHRKAEGYSGAVVISEFGWLGRTLKLGRRDNDMVAVFDRYVQGFDTIPDILGWAWFSEWCPATLNDNDFDLSNLVFDDGTFTPTGIKFREKLQIYP
jgi:hypothetical protein